MSKLRQERQRLSQEANLSYVRNDFSPTDMVPVYSPQIHHVALPISHCATRFTAAVMLDSSYSQISTSSGIRWLWCLT